VAPLVDRVRRVGQRRLSREPGEPQAPLGVPDACAAGPFLRERPRLRPAAEIAWRTGGGGSDARAGDVVVRDLDEVFAALAKSAFRRRFRLRGAELDYLRSRGLDTVMRHAADFIARRLAPAEPENDGRQTPMRGHPVFLAQHATGTCCRGCLAKWHGIGRGRVLDDAERAHVLAAIRRWTEEQDAKAPEAASDAASDSRPPAQGELGL
jgi:predicted Fe-S protein YdhL (DUF1289 family)